MSDNPASAEVPTLDEEAFIELLTREQPRLLYYVTMLLGDRDAAENVLQETNLVLWRKSSEFRPGSEFSAWAHKVAYWQTQAFVRDRGRDRHVFSEELVSQLASHQGRDTELSESRSALRACLDELSEAHLELIQHRYESNASAAEIAKSVGRSELAVRAVLMRIRRALQKCVKARLESS